MTGDLILCARFSGFSAADELGGAGRQE